MCEVAGRTDIHIMLWFCEVTEMGSHAEGIGKLNLSHTPAVLLEMSQGCAEGTQTELM